MRALLWVGLVAYPFLLWGAIVQFGIRISSVVAVALAVVLVPLRLRWSRGLFDRETVIGTVGLFALGLLSALLRDRRFLLAIPVVINVVLLFVFAASLLRGRVPIAERVARNVEPELSAAKRRYCRSVTVVWCCFFVMNGVTTLLLALYGSLEMWSLYSGLGAYVAMGALFAAEYAVRRVRFYR